MRRTQHPAAAARHRRPAPHARTGDPGAACLPPPCDAGRRARRGHRPVGRGAAGPRWSAARADPARPYPRTRSGAAVRAGRARRHEPRDLERRDAARALLRPGPFLPGGLHDRRQRGGEFRRGSLSQARTHRSQPARAARGHHRRRAARVRSDLGRGAGPAAARTAHGIGRHARGRARSDGAPRAAAGAGGAADGRVRRRAQLRRGRRPHHRLRRRAGRARDDGRAGDPRGRGFRELRLPRRCRGAAALRARRSRPRGAAGTRGCRGPARRMRGDWPAGRNR